MRISFIDLFKRKTSGKNFIPEIDGLRFIAIISVVIFHFHFLLAKEIGNQVTMDIQNSDIWNPGWWFIRMDLGVKLFFGISGFILSVPFLKQYWFGGKEVNLKAYFIRRLTRLEPPFIIAVTGFLIVHWLVLGENIFELLPHFGATLLYVHTIIYNSYSIILPVTWSLETEVQFYLIIPFLAYFGLSFKNKKLSLLLASILFIFSIAFRGYLLREGLYGMMASLPAFFSYFLVGILFAYLFLTNQEWLRDQSFFWDLIGFLAFFGMFLFYKPQADFVKQIFFNFSIFILFISAFKGVLINSCLRVSWVYLIGGMCYTIYLIHLPFFALFTMFSSRFILWESYSANLGFQFFLAFLILMGISSLFYLMVEKPCMDKDWHFKLLKKLGLLRTD